MTDSGDEEAIEAAAAFDKLIDAALDEREVQYGHPVFEHHHLRRMRVGSLAEAYRKGGVFPPDRISGVVWRAVDVKLQLYITGEILPGFINAGYHDKVNYNPALARSASVQLVRLSLRQDMITKSRILWDRIMGLVYYIETGKEDIPRSGSRSAKRTFFELCRTTPHWRWLVAYESALNAFDDRFRTPEVHKRSMLRALLVREEGDEGLDNELMTLLNHAMNQIWDNIESIVSGGGVRSLGMAHMELDDKGQMLLEPSPFDRWGWTTTDPR